MRTTNAGLAEPPGRPKQTDQPAGSTPSALLLLLPVGLDYAIWHNAPRHSLARSPRPVSRDR
jgi:hypothetical protein